MSSETTATILVVDDNPAGRYGTSRILRANGFSVLEAATGNEGLALAPQADLVVLDVNLPDISGFEICRRLRSTHATSRIPVVHLSATFVKDMDKVEGLEAGADGYLTHPVEPPVLVATVNAFLRARRAEEEMRRSEAKFKAIFEQALSGILLVSKELICLEANPAMCHMLGHKREEIVGKHISSFIPAGHEFEALEIQQGIEKHSAWRGMFPLLRADGKHVELEWSIAPLSVPGVRLAIVNDITERKAHEAERESLLAGERAAREEAERANRLKDEFLATLSHELRTPLNAIVGWSQILKRSEPSAADITEGIDAIARNAQAQTQLISDLLEISRITSGKLRLEIRAMDAAAVIDAALETMAPAYQAKNIRVERELDSSVGMIQGDPDRMQQVVWNLVNNAVKFTPKNGTIRVKLGRDHSYVTITVSDNGQGIKPEFLPYIFERFRQENATSRRNQGGLGLGLAIVKHLVEMHGGTVTALSDGEGRGASFVVRMPVAALKTQQPVARSEKEKAPAAAPRGQAAAVRLDGVRILMVEDDADARALLRHVLVRAGADVREAADVTIAMKLLTDSMPDVVISDVGIPDQDGYDLIRKIRARHNEKELPAIALTAFARSEDSRKSLEAGFQIHLSKPVNSDELMAAVVSVMGQENTGR